MAIMANYYHVALELVLKMSDLCALGLQVIIKV